jgi:hypothetical protein
MTEEFLEKYKATCLEKYGVEHYSMTEEFLEQYEKTCLEKYGFRHPMQNADYFENIREKLFKLEPFTFPSGEIIMVQGYEKECLYDLLKKHNYKEENIITQATKMPTFLYNFGEKERRYYPDIMIKTGSNIKFIEVKSEYTFNIDLEKNIAKWQTVLKNGFKIEIWIYEDGKRSDIKIINRIEL